MLIDCESVKIVDIFIYQKGTSALEQRKRLLDILNEPELEESLYNSGMFYVDYCEGFGQVSKICQSLGISYAEMTSRKYQERIHEDDLKTYIRLWNRFDEGLDDELYCEYRMFDHKGEWNWVQTHATVLSRDDSGSIRKIIGFDRIINGRKKTEEIIHKQFLEEKKKNEISEIVHSASKHILVDHDLSDQLSESLDKMKSIVGFDYCAVFIHKGSYKQVFKYPKDEYFEIPDTTELIKQVNLSQYPIISDSVIKGLGSVMAVPLLSDSENIGSIILFNESAVSFNGTDLYPVISFSDILTVVIINHYTFKKIVGNLEKDHLTGFLTRKSFEKAMADMKREVSSGRKCCNVCMIDIDHFKCVNDTYGHQLGDEVIRIFAQICRKILRNSDILGRYGGEEFIIVLKDGRIEDVEKVMERIRGAIEHYNFPHLDSGITVSIGISNYKSGDSIDSIINRADNALYTAKETGRNRIVIV